MEKLPKTWAFKSIPEFKFWIYKYEKDNKVRLDVAGTHIGEYYYLTSKVLTKWGFSEGLPEDYVEITFEDFLNSLGSSLETNTYLIY